MLRRMKHSPGFLALVDDARRRIRECGIDDVRARLDRGERFHLVDVREDDEFAVDRIAGARHIGRGVLERDIETLIPGKDEPIVLYCGGGFRSALAADNLQRMGYTNVVSMDGGIRAWRDANHPIEKAK
jgi:rhodanese-related sulfurtransferase